MIFAPCPERFSLPANSPALHAQVSLVAGIKRGAWGLACHERPKPRQLRTITSNHPIQMFDFLFNLKSQMKNEQSWYYLCCTKHKNGTEYHLYSAHHILITKLCYMTFAVLVTCMINGSWLDKFKAARFFCCWPSCLVLNFLF